MDATFKLAFFYASTFLGTGVFMTFLPVQFRTLGASAGMITAVFAGRQLIAALMPAVWGLWSDLRGNARIPVTTAAVLAAVSLLPLPFVEDANSLAVLLLLHASASCALVPLADGMTLTVLKSQPQGFGRIRMFGTLSFGVGVLAFTWLLPGAASGSVVDAARLALPVLLGCALLNVVVAIFLPSVQRERLETAAGASSVWKNVALWHVMLPGAFHWAAHAPYAVMFGVHLQDLGLSARATSVALACAVGVEMAVMAAAPRFIGKVSIRHVLLGTCALGVVRWVITATATSSVVIIAAQATHGITFGLFYVASVGAVHACVPAQARSSGQAAFTSVVFGAGGIVGTLLAGPTYDAGKGPWMFFMCAGLELVALGLLAAWREPSLEQPAA